MKFHRPQSHATHPNVVPLIDVIMCMIVFFMLVARIGVSSGEDASINIPYAALGRQIKSLDNTLLVNVKEINGRPEVTSQIDSTSGRGRETLVLEGTGGRRLADVLKRLRYGDDLREGQSRPGGRDNPDLKLIVRGDADMTYGVLQQVLLAAAEANVTSLNFQTTQRERSGR